MEEGNKREEKIFNYIHNLMNDTERALFISEMDADEELKREVLLMNDLREGFNNKKPLQHETVIKRLIREEENSITHVKGKSPVVRYVIGLAASLIIAFAIYYFYQRNATNSREFSLASIEVVPIKNQLDSLPVTTRSSDDKWISQTLSEERFNEFLERAEVEFRQDKNSKKLNYAFIHTLLYKGKYEEASRIYNLLPAEMKSGLEFRYLEGFIELNTGGKAGMSRAVFIFQNVGHALPSNHPLKLNTQAILKKLNTTSQ